MKQLIIDNNQIEKIDEKIHCTVLERDINRKNYDGNKLQVWHFFTDCIEVVSDNVNEYETFDLRFRKMLREKLAYFFCFK